MNSRAKMPTLWRVTILEVIQRSADFLAKKGVESPRLQVELMLAHALKMPRMKLYLSFERVLTETELAALRTMVQRRGNREPLQYILGSVNFCGLELMVDRRVLIPRPETELLAERAWNYVLQSAISNPQSAIVLDLCTGSGCLAIAIAAKAPHSQVHASDISADALVVARENAGRHQVQERIQFYQGDCFAALPKDLRFDLIVSNPPYIATAEVATLEPELRDHEPKNALDGGADGLDFYRRIAGEAKSFLADKGKLMLELGDGQAAAVGEIFREQKWIVETVEADYSRLPRILVASI